jgi:hypothetical protein
MRQQTIKNGPQRNGTSILTEFIWLSSGEAAGSLDERMKHRVP